MMCWYGYRRQQFVSRALVDLFFFILFMSEFFWLVSSQEGKIIGGREARRGEFPATVLLSGPNRCGATLISLKKIITAARCFFVNEKPVDAANFLVTAGVVNIKSNSSEKQVSHLSDYKIHEKYVYVKHTYGSATRYDMAVGMFKSPFYRSETVKPAVLPATNWEGMKKVMVEINATNAVCIATGFGADTQDGQIESDVLKLVDLHIVPEPECDIPTEMFDYEVCATSQQPSDQTSPGDTGSSFLCGGYIIGMFKGRKKSVEDSKRAHFMAFTLFGPYMEYFKLGDGAHCFHLHPAIFVILLFISFFWS